MNKLNAATAKAAADWRTKRLQSGDKEKFRAFLEVEILKALETDGQIFLECDYDPFGLLLDAVKEAGHKDCRGFMFSARGILPQKHTLDITPGLLKPKEGYGNWTAEIKVDCFTTASKSLALK
jgi:hypothetical protein